MRNVRELEIWVKKPDPKFNQFNLDPSIDVTVYRPSLLPQRLEGGKESKDKKWVSFQVQNHVINKWARDQNSNGLSTREVQQSVPSEVHHHFNNGTNYLVHFWTRCNRCPQNERVFQDMTAYLTGKIMNEIPNSNQIPVNNDVLSRNKRNAVSKPNSDCALKHCCLHHAPFRFDQLGFTQVIGKLREN